MLFIGVITEEILAQTKSEELIGPFIDVKEAANELSVICDNYKTTDTDYTVLLTHIGFEKDKELAELIDRNCGVDLIIGGHSHTLLSEPCVVNGINIVQVGCGTDNIGRLSVEFDSASGKVSSTKWQCVEINEENCPNDDVLEEVLLRYKSPTDEKYGRVLTTFARELTHPSRIQETEIGNLFADMLQQDSSFDIMLLGSGSIRKQKLGPIVQFKDLKEIFPYDDSIHMLTVSGSQLRKMITYVLRDEAYEGHTEFYQYSKGVKIIYDKKKHEIKKFSLNGRDIIDSDMIKIALQTYHYNNFTEFFGVPFEEVAANKRPKVVMISSFGIFEEMMSNASRMDSKVEGRLVIEG